MSNWVHLDVDEIVSETDNAFLLLISYEEIWIPKSQISNPNDYSKGDKNCTISITNWIAKQKGIEIDE